MFKFLKGNRPLDAYHLRKLRNSIELSNHLDLHPIIINANNEIIDGQHRYTVAKELGVPLFYIKSEDVEDNHVVACNAAQKPFELKSYIDYFADKEMIQDYIVLKEFIFKSKLTAKPFLGLIYGCVTPKVLDLIKGGQFKLPDIDKLNSLLGFYVEFITFVKARNIKPIYMTSNSKFVMAFKWFAQIESLDKELFMKKLEYRWFELKPQVSSKEWLNVLLSIYNYRNNKNRLTVDEISELE